LKRYFGIDLRDLFSDENPLSPRWVLLHIQQLPMGSSFVAEIRGGIQFRGWDEDRYMRAAFIDSVRVLQYILILCNSDPNKPKAQPPDPYPLPDNVKRTEQDSPGSFGFIAKKKIAEARRRQELKRGGVDGWR
jgi:hypothetical protein